jgi:hypothetical protein
MLARASGREQREHRGKFAALPWFTRVELHLFELPGLLVQRLDQRLGRGT